jgi:hypothetical protein
MFQGGMQKRQVEPKYTGAPLAGYGEHKLTSTGPKLFTAGKNPTFS